MSTKILTNLDFNNTGKLINVLDPTAAQDVATKNYVDTRPDTDVGKFTAVIGDGVASSFALTHGLGNKNLIASVYLVADGSRVQTDIIVTTTLLTVTFDFVPSAGAYFVVAIG